MASPQTPAIDTVEFAKALADQTRQRIMAICCCTELNVSEIVDRIDVAQPTVSHHLKILRQAGLVRSVRRGKEIYYTLDQRQLAQACCQVAADFAPDLSLELTAGKVP
jgi:ArsR family transcriptional regulator